MYKFASRYLLVVRDRWLNWTKPHNHVTSHLEMIRAQALSSILLAIFIIAVVFEIGSILFSPEVSKYFLTDITAIFSVGILFLSSRTQHYKITAYVAAFTITLVSFAEVVLSIYQPTIVFMILSFFIAATALSSREAVAIAITNIIFAMAIPIFVPQWTLSDIVIEVTFIILATIAFYALMFIQSYYIRLHEEKSEELEVANELLGEQIFHLVESRLALEKSEQNFHKIFRSSPDPIVINNLRTGEFVDYNNSFMEQSGYSADDLRGMTAGDLWANQDDVSPLINTLKQTGYIYGLETAFKTKAGEIRDAVISSEIMELDGEDCVVSTARDITLYKQAQRQQQEVERERERSAILRQFVTSVSHDFRTPLATIITSLYLLEKVKDEDRRKKHVKTISGQVERLESLVEALITMSLLDDETTLFQFYPVNVNDLVKICVQVLDNPNKIDIHLDLATQLPLIHADSGQLEKALLHILKNAILFTPLGGNIQVTTRLRDASVQIICKDTGIGIEEVDLPHIFERLYRGDKARNETTGGNGLGLSITRKIIERHQGTIDASSESGQGSEFIVTLPVLPVNKRV